MTREDGIQILRGGSSLMLGKKLLYLLLTGALLVSIGTGCKAQPQDTEKPKQTEEPKAKEPKTATTIKVGYPSAMGLNAVPSIVGWEQFMPEGYQVKTTFYPTIDVATKALLSSEVDVTIISPESGQQAILQGADIKGFVTHKGNEWVLVTPSSVKTPKDLNGKRIAIHSRGGTQEALIKWFAKTNGIQPLVSAIPGSENRSAALLKGQIEGSPLEISDALFLEKQAPGKFHILANFVDSFPINVAAFTTNNYLKSHKDALTALTKALLTGYRKANEDAGWVVSNAKRLMPDLDEKTALDAVKEYQKMGLWGNNGNFSAEIGKKQVDFFTKAGLLKDGLEFSKWGTTEILDEVLKEIGRK